jgi:hypothetical protein
MLLSLIVFESPLAGLRGMMKLLLEIMMALTTAAIFISIVVLVINIHRNERGRPSE